MCIDKIFVVPIIILLFTIAILYIGKSDWFDKLMKDIAKFTLEDKNE